jgi:hypothetical protein
MVLYQRDRRFQQLGKQKRQQQNEESNTGYVEDNCQNQKESHGGDYVPRAIVN